MPTPINLFAAIVFGGVGMAAFVYGKKAGTLKPILIGIGLMVYPYFVSQTWILVGIGILLTASLFVLKD